MTVTNRTVGTFHFFEQAWFRYELALDEDDAQRIADALDNGMGTETSIESNRTPSRKSYLVKYKNKMLHVVYDFEGRRLITALSDSDGNPVYVVGDKAANPLVAKFNGFTETKPESKECVTVENSNGVLSFKTEPLKRCSRCKEDLTHDSFHKKTKSKDGLQTYCKDCSRKYNQQRHKAGGHKNVPQKKLTFWQRVKGVFSK